MEKNSGIYNQILKRTKGGENERRRERQEERTKGGENTHTPLTLPAFQLGINILE